jgi:hypothetical protein
MTSKAEIMFGRIDLPMGAPERAGAGAGAFAATCER